MSERVIAARSDARRAGQHAPDGGQALLRAAERRARSKGGFVLAPRRAPRAHAGRQSARRPRPARSAELARRMGGAGRDDRSGRHAADPARQFGDRRRRGSDRRDARRDSAATPAPTSFAIAPRRRKTLVAREAAAFDPVLGWAARDARRAVHARRGVTHVAQPPEALAAIGAALEAFDDPFAFAALHRDDDPDRLALLALAVARGRLAPEAAGWPPMSTRISRSSAGAKTRKRRRGARRAARVRRGGNRSR